MPITQAVFQKQYHIRYSEIDAHGKLKIVNILNYLQDTASCHAYKMGISGFDFLPHGLAWVIYRYHLKIVRYPEWEEPINVKTWRYPSGNIYELRQFEITDNAGNILIHAKNAWVLINIAKKKPVRLKNNLPETLDNLKKEITYNFKKFPEFQNSEITLPFKIRMHDMDLNKHVNNAVYAGWATETVPEYIITDFQPSQMDIIFLNDAVYGDNIISSTSIIETSPQPVLSHKIVKAEDKKELSKINTIWQKRKL